MKVLLDRILDPTFDGLSKALDLSWRRNEAIASNVSNADTPGYRAIDLDFSGELDRAFGNQDKQLATTSTKHFTVGGDPQSSHLVADFSGATKPDGNNVDIDLQMGRLAQNRAQYTNAANLMRKKFSILQTIIRGLQ